MRAITSLCILVVIAALSEALTPHARYAPYAKRGLRDMNRLLLCHTGKPLFKYIQYGCHCGYEGKGEPVDDLDRCCMEKGRCYKGISESQVCGPNEDALYRETYATSSDCNSCVRGQGECRSQLCECDLAAAKCIKAATYNPDHARYNRDKC
ncbi:neutral phospholipase A2 homolog taipoxin beta chain 2 [Nematostella vectensis]|uniref:neutral phospholipase A2 homolog taipoxin beta chain 2 n=1 Tax=Nematostella vectensis TaxID=45351 RepID=UPI00139026A5|nr:neutral phospholipase A2 homolog taipoxin beta chain 2 [Nematostella vectensis]